jgi:myo-inositol-1(or 4)-monophosphatase
MIGTVTSDLAYLACGRADLLVNHAARPWDVEAGKLLLLEAGGKASIQERKDRTISIYSNSIIHQDAESLIQTQQ